MTAHQEYIIVIILFVEFDFIVICFVITEGLTGAVPWLSDNGTFLGWVSSYSDTGDVENNKDAYSTCKSNYGASANFVTMDTQEKYDDFLAHLRYDQHTGVCSLIKVYSDLWIVVDFEVC